MIRAALPADLEAVRALTASAYAVYRDVLDTLPVPVTEDYAPRIARGEVWIQERDGCPAGLIVLEPARDHLLIFSIALAPSFRGTGLGRRLLGFAEDRAREAGLAEVRLYTNAKMTRNIALYAHCGYVETGRRTHPQRPGWMLVDMTKRVS